MIENKDKLDELYRNSFDNYELPVSDRVLTNLRQELSLSTKIGSKNSVSKLSGWKWILLS